jgi:hypothetical protein
MAHGADRARPADDMTLSMLLIAFGWLLLGALIGWIPLRAEAQRADRVDEPAADR